LNYYLSTGLFNCFPIPQHEPGALATLRYMGELMNERSCILIFPEGRMTRQGEIAPFQPGVGMIASKLEVPVVPIRIDGLDQVLHEGWKWAHPGPVRIAFGPPLRLTGDNYLMLAKEVEESVRKL
jgi:long-chain acyl-CoA synthetase